MKMRRTQVFSCLCLLLATPAYAWGGDVSQSREVYHDTLAVRMANGSIAHAVLSFTVTAVAYVGEDGNARWPDNRACYYNDVRRTLVRSLTLTTADGTVIPVRDTTVALPNAGGNHWGAVTTCNDKIAEINSRLMSDAGNAQTWQAYIDGERSEVQKILSQFGQVVPA